MTIHHAQPVTLPKSNSGRPEALQCRGLYEEGDLELFRCQRALKEDSA